MRGSTRRASAGAGLGFATHPSVSLDGADGRFHHLEDPHRTPGITRKEVAGSADAGASVRGNAQVGVDAGMTAQSTRGRGTQLEF
jgi:hypothetical protein